MYLDIRGVSSEGSGNLPSTQSPKRTVAPYPSKCHSSSTMVDVHIPTSCVAQRQRIKHSLQTRVDSALLESPAHLNISLDSTSKSTLSFSQSLSNAKENIPASSDKEKVIPNCKLVVNACDIVQTSENISKSEDQSTTEGLCRWAAKAHDLMFIDEDSELNDKQRCVDVSPSHSGRQISCVRSRSVGHLNVLDAVAINNPGPTLSVVIESPRRLFLAQNRNSKPKQKLVECGKSRSLDSSPQAHIRDLSSNTLKSAKKVESLKPSANISHDKLIIEPISPPPPSECSIEITEMEEQKKPPKKNVFEKSALAPPSPTRRSTSEGCRSTPSTPLSRRKVRRHQSSSPVR